MQEVPAEPVEYGFTFTDRRKMASAMKYLVYRIKDGVCVNVILWDGESEYNPGNGFALEIIPPGSLAWTGWVRQPDGEWVEPITEEEAS